MSCPLMFARNQDGLYFKTVSSITQEGAAGLFVESTSKKVHIISIKDFPINNNYEKIASLLGFIQLKLNKYAVIANTVEETGRLNGHIIYKVVQHSIVPVSTNANLIDSDDAEYLKLLELQLNNATLFYSYTYDLTNSLQRNESIDKYIWQTVDDRFFWNHFITEELRQLASVNPQVSQFIQPVIYGYAKVVDTIFQSTSISVGLITRRSRFRAGTRYFRRGVDEDGNVGNYNENEQVLVVQNNKHDKIDMFSFLQTRGSVPVYWAEINNLRYKPNLVLGDNSTLESTKKHFDKQIALYGDNYLVNLVNQKGYELPVKQAYENAVETLNNDKLHYVYFDFHHECRKMQWHRVKLLIDQLSELGLSNNDIFHKEVTKDGMNTIRVISKQTSTVRTNCMDCLDRTNVVQSVLAHWVLQKEFEISGLTNEGQLWEMDKSLLSIFQNLWADNADAVSFAYSGTGALKTDFTRTGNRTRMGAVNDLINSISRYYQNNLTDGPRQDSYDLFLGNFKPDEIVSKSPFTDKRTTLIQFLPTLFYAAVTVLFATVFFPKNNFSSYKNLMFFFISFITAIFTGKLIADNGLQFVNWPKLADVGFLKSNTTYNEKQFMGKSFKYEPSDKYKKPVSTKKE